MRRPQVVIIAALALLIGCSLFLLRGHLAALDQRVAELEHGRRVEGSKGAAKQAPKAPPEGKVGFVVSTRRIPAYAMVMQEDILNHKTAAVARVYLPPEEVYGNFRGNLHQVLHRVLRREKPPGQIFVDEDFFPLGTRPGPMAGVPAGKRGVWVETSEVPGLEELNQHDRLDLLMTIEVGEKNAPVRDDDAEPEATKNQPKSVSSASPRGPGNQKRVEVRTIVTNGEVVQPADGNRTRVFIAVDPEETSALSLARSLDGRLEVAVRSGQPSGDASQGVVPDLGWIRVYKPASIPALPANGDGDK